MRTTVVFQVVTRLSTTFLSTVGVLVDSGLWPERNSQKPPPDADSRVPVSSPVIDTPRSPAFAPSGVTKWNRPLLGSSAVRQRPAVSSTSTGPLVSIGVG